MKVRFGLKDTINNKTMGYTNKLYLGAYLHVKTESRLYDLVGDREDLSETPLGGDDSLVLIQNISTGLIVDVGIDDEEDTEVDFSLLSPAAMIQNFMLGYENIIDLIMTKVPPDSVKVKFGLLKYCE